MRYPALLTSLAVAAVLSGCGEVRQDVTRSNPEVLSFSQDVDAAVIQDRAVALNAMAEQLARQSALYGTASTANGASQGAEAVPASALVESIRNMNGQISALQSSLPELVAEQDAKLSRLKVRRSTRTISRQNFELRTGAIQESRVAIVASLTQAIQQTEQASLNITAAVEQGQQGLVWHLGATNQLARAADSVRSTISPLESVARPQTDRIVLNAAPRSGELR